MLIPGGRVPGGADCGRHGAASGRCRADPGRAVPLEGSGAYLKPPGTAGPPGSWRRACQALTTNPPGR